MREVVERSRGLTGADAAVLELVEGDEMVYRAVAGTAAGHLGLRLRAEASFSGLCARTGEIIYSEGTESDPRVDRAATRAVGARSMLAVPLRHRGRPPYVLKVYSGRAAAFGPGWRWLRGTRPVVTVADTGVGIPEAEQARLFERFFRASSATSGQIPGSGLGLSIVKTPVELHGGSIGVDSNERRGTTVRVGLPRMPR